MQIQNLFERDIHRSINGVVKADQLDEGSIWQELDEFVVTRELNRHIGDLVEVLLSCIQSEASAADKNGIWVSGFFGCGKSHLIKVLSYLLENQVHRFDGQSQRAVDFFEDKLGDPMVYADLKNVVANPTDTILFNIDSKADHRGGRDALLAVFLKVLNEKQGYCGEHPHIANLERHLDEKGKLKAFQAAFEREAGSPWMEERDAWEFHRDQVVIGVMEALGQSKESVEAWVDGAEKHFSMTVENFARWVKRYLDGFGPKKRIMFLVDEVGQFIGNDTHLMLNLQTITEQLGTICRGRAWVVVTSQEDLDAVLGDLKSTKQHDFSKIQGRFKTRLSLSSANVDEVIKRRLLAKSEQAHAPLLTAYQGKHDILGNQLSFLKAGMSFPKYADAADFSACYPFPAYQFLLVQKVFESIRKAGATGLHLSQGERSTLDAFQSAARQLGESQVGALVPFYAFYPAVEGFLDTAVKRTIEQAKEKASLEAFDALLLQVLFLIRYIEELPGSVENLVTLCVDQIDADKLLLRKKIEESLGRLERETLVARNGDLYFFLTNEERDIGNEIKGFPLASGAEERALGKLLFEDILGDLRKHKYSLSDRDFSFSRICDDFPVGPKGAGELVVEIVTPLGERYQEFSQDANCLMQTTGKQHQILIRLPDHKNLGQELRTYLKTEEFVRTKDTATLPETTKRILRDRSADNRERRKRLVHFLEEMFAQASFFTSGNPLDVGGGPPREALGKALEYLIRNAYPKMGHLEKLLPLPKLKQEIQSLLRANDVEQLGLSLEGGEPNPKAMADLREYIRLCGQSSKQIVLREMIETRYGQRPYGWPELEVVLLVARLAVRREITLVVHAAPLPVEQAYEYLISPAKQKKVVIRVRQKLDKQLIKQAQALGKELFARQGPGGEDELFEFLAQHLRDWQTTLKQYQAVSQGGAYPGGSETQELLKLVGKQLARTESVHFLKAFVAEQETFLEASEDFSDLRDFHNNQHPTWDRLREAVERLSPNRHQLEAHPEGGPALRRLKEIQAAPRPYGLLPEVAGLLQEAEAANQELLDAIRGASVAAIQKRLSLVETELASVSADLSFQKRVTDELEKLRDMAASESSLAHIEQAVALAETAFEKALEQISKWTPPDPGPDVGSADLSPEPAPPAPKKIRTVAPRELAQNFLETEADVNLFVDALKDQLMSALKSGQRIRIK
jgi:hypothetical protein